MFKRTNKVTLMIFTIFMLNIFGISNAFSHDNTSKSVYVHRLQGSNRYETSASICNYGWKNNSDNIILANGENFPDSLCASPLAAKLKAPILLTGKSSLNDATKTEINRLKAKNVYIIGGVGVISENIENELKNKNLNVVRVFGKDRYETSMKIAQLIGKTDSVFVVTGDGFSDGLCVATIAAKKGMAMILTPKHSLPEGMNTYLEDNGVKKAYIIGGSEIIDENVFNNLPAAERIQGKNRYETNIAVLSKFNNDFNYNTIYMTTGEDFPDALSTAALACSTSSPIFLTSPNLDEATKNFISAKGFLINNVNVIGGESIVGNNIVQAVKNQGEPNSKKYLEIKTYDGKHQSCHPKVMYFPEAWNGWKYWMALTPYPNSNDQFENPSLVVSNDGHNWITPKGLQNPIIVGPNKKGMHNSDVHIVLNTNTNEMEMWYRFTAYDMVDEVLRVTSKDGIHWSEPQLMLIFYNQFCLSPAILFEDNKYKFWYVNENLQCSYIESTDGISWTSPVQINLNLKDTYLPWHLDVVHTDLGYEMLLSGFKKGELKLNNRVLMAGISSDGMNYNNMDIILRPKVGSNSWDNKQIYRSSFVKVDGIYKLYYSAMDKNFKWHIGLSEGTSLSSLHGSYYLNNNN